jgi:hypothetical protein
MIRSLDFEGVKTLDAEDNSRCIQGSYMTHVRKSQIQTLFKDIQGHVSVSNSFVRYEHAKSIQQNVRF